MDNLYNELLKILDKEQIYINELMSKHTSFHIGGPADIFIKVQNVEQLKRIIKVSNDNNIPITIIGNGSNILVKDRWY